MNTRSRTIRIVTIVLGVLIVASLVLSIVGCTSGDDGGSVEEFTEDGAPSRAEVITGISEQIIVPAQQDLAETTAELTESTTALCAVPTAESLAAAREAWDAAQSAWRRTEAFRFGPAKSLHSIGQIAYPVDLEKLDAQFATPGELPEPITAESVADLGADVRGLAAIEHLLFAPASVADLGAAQCEYLSAAAVDVQDGAADLLTAWTTGIDDEPAFTTQMQEPGDDSMYAKEQDVVNDLVNGSIAALTTIADMELGTASGATTGTPEPATVDSGAAHRALADVVDMLTSVTNVYGTAGGEDTSDTTGDDLGLSVLVADQSLVTDRRLLATFADATAAVAAIPAPLVDLDPADAAQLALVEDAYNQVSDARVAMRTEVASLLGVTVGFSDSDGDG